MSLAFNFYHGTHEQHARTIATVRDLAEAARASGSRFSATARVHASALAIWTRHGLLEPAVGRRLLSGA
jgi:hypothetical protein